MAATSHDLRQPLHAQSLMLDVLSRKLHDTTSNELIQKVIQSNDALTALFNSLLEVSQLDAGTITVHTADYSLTEVSELIVDQFREIAGQKNLSLEMTGDDCVIHSDAILLSRVLQNLVGNAIKFTSEGGVKIDFKKQASEVVLAVTDTGMGIPRSEQQRIFNEYTQLGNHARDRSKGIGLGLAIAQRICKLLNHPIKVESTLSHGSCFSLMLPVGNPDKVVSMRVNEEVSPLGGLNVLLIDDDRQVLEAMQSLLAEWACKTRCYTTYRESAEEIDASDFVPDLILCDYRLNERINGVEAIQHLRQSYGSDVPAIIITGDTDPVLLEQIKNQEFYLLHKPLRAAKLRRVIGVLLDQNSQKKTFQSNDLNQ